MPKYLRILSLVAVALLMFSGTANALSVDWREVTLTMDGETSSHRTTAATVGGFLSEQGITPGRLDTVTPGASVKLDSGEATQITIAPGFNVAVSIDGKKQELGVPAGAKAGDVIKELESKNSESYAYDGEKAEALSPKQTLALWRIVTEEQSITVPLMYDTQIIPDDQLEIGTEQVEREGAAGEMRIISSLTLINGEVTKSQVMSEDVTKDPVTEIVRRGTKLPPPMVDTEIGLRPYTQMMEMQATAYSAHYECTGKNPGHPAYGLTASGMPVNHGVVAVDPSVIPLGTRLFVEGYGEAVAADTGSAIVGNKIDLYHESFDDAIRYGRRTVKVYILS